MSLRCRRVAGGGCRASPLSYLQTVGSDAGDRQIVLGVKAAVYEQILIAAAERVADVDFAGCLGLLDSSKQKLLVSIESALKAEGVFRLPFTTVAAAVGKLVDFLGLETAKMWWRRDCGAGG